MEFKIPEPCHERWEDMERRGDGRFCQHCQHTVVDLSGLSRRQAEARVRRARGSLCVQLALDETDAAVFRPEPSRAPHWAGGLVLVAALGAGGCSEPAAASDEVTVSEVPCSLPEDPMMPVSEGPPVVVEVADPRFADTPSAEVGDGTPTAEQLELTRRKQQGQTQVRPAVRPPHTHLARGRMPVHRR